MSNSDTTFSLENNVPGKHKFNCKECSKETTHTIVASYKEAGSQDCGGGNSYDWNVNNQIIQCQGCDTVSFRVVSMNSEDCMFDDEENCLIYNETIKFYPGRTVGLKKIDSDLLPFNVQGIYQETISAIENEQNILAGIGIRALIETICKDRSAVGKDLYGKINWLHEQSIVTKEGVETLHKLRVLGNNAAHEVKKHNHQQLSLAIQIIEHMLDGTYIIPHKVAKTFKSA